MIYCLKSKGGIECYELYNNLFYLRLYVFYNAKYILESDKVATFSYETNTLLRMFSGTIITEEELSNLVAEVKAELI